MGLGIDWFVKRSIEEKIGWIGSFLFGSFVLHSLGVILSIPRPFLLPVITVPMIYSILILFAVVFQLIWQAFQKFRTFKPRSIERLLSLLLITLLLGASIGLLVPESGVDALWFHLPMAQDILLSPDQLWNQSLYQTTLPRLGSYLFAIPYALFGFAGVKLTTFAVGLLCLALLGRIISRITGVKSADVSVLFSVVFFLSIHTVFWQMTSGYADLFRAMFELAVISLFLRKSSRPLLIGVLLGLALSIRSIALIYLPILLVPATLFLRKNLVLVVGIGLIIMSSWYLQAQYSAGSFLIGWQATVGDLHTADGVGIVEKALNIMPNVAMLPVAPLILALDLEMFSPVFLVFIIPLVRLFQTAFRNRDLPLLSLFWILIAGLLFWLLVPPRSLRYILTSIGVGSVLLGIAWSQISSKTIQTLIMIVLIGTIVIRVGTNLRNLTEYLGYPAQTRNQQYLERRFTGPVLQGIYKTWISR